MRKTALLAWELGLGLGHLACLYQMAQILKKMNCRVVIAVKDLSTAHIYFQPLDDVYLVQSPIWLPKIKMDRNVVCLPDVLFLKGYLRCETIKTLVDSWRSLINLIEPNLIVANYAPTAMLASYQLPLARLVVGSGYSDPAPGNRIIGWGEETQNNIVLKQEHALMNMLQQSGVVPNEMSHYSDIYDCESTIITTVPALDVYELRRKKTIYSFIRGKKLTSRTVSWPANGRARILCYLKPNYSNISLLLSTLSNSSHEIFIVCPGGNMNIFKKYIRKGLRVTTEVIDFFESVGSSHLFVGHGNLGTCTEALLKGIPILVFPIQLENVMHGKKIEKFGAGKILTAVENEKNIERSINNIIDDESYRKKAVTIMNTSRALMKLPFEDCFQETVARSLRYRP